MRNNSFAGLTALAVVALLAGSAAAQSVSPAQGRHAHADANGDGRISQAEFVQGRTERLTAIDADRDGSLTAEEMRAGMQARRAEHMAQRFERLDSDKNGAISRPEFDAARPQQTGRAGPGQGVRMGRHHRAGRGMGRGGGERMAARGPVAIADVQTRASEVFARLDADQDGFLTAEEVRSGRQAWRGHRQGRMTRPIAPTVSQTPASPPAPASE